MQGSPRTSGYYFAQQFGFNGVDDVGYTGLQPRPDSRRRQVVHAAFSSFQNRTTTKHKNCHSGADGSLGVSCALDIFGDYSHFYNISVKNTGGTTWRGTLIDTVTGKSDVIGEWMLPSSAGKMLNGQVGFFEYYNWSDVKCSSATPPQRQKELLVAKSPSFTRPANASKKLNLKATQTGKGYQIQAGFK
ncbi:hypothetical protein Focb16_v014342 [Fusarium oxysporum f. sp. cubense]|uniref:Uncharacterized protein n=1 Tax=Fusarium oxysporum f. sp. cubense TaxID=61366 RepID=A0A559KVC4_FUSOC|nr:hypothetical protein Focb16_v014342 [Fusarium oxysporum f. sp. cubense]